MVITYIGKQFFKVQFGDMVVAFNPVSKKSSFASKAPHFGSVIALSTINHPDYNGFEMVEHGDTVPFQIIGAGDYEVKDIFIKGIGVETTLDKKPYINTIYTLTIDSINLCFLGVLSSATLSAEAKEAIGSPDIIFVPIGGNGMLSPRDAYNLAESFDPSLVIPMDYGSDADKDALKVFLKEAGEEKMQTVDKLTLKRKDLEGKEGDVVLLASEF